MFHQHCRRGSDLTADGEALDQACQHNDQRCEDADLRIGGGDGEQQRTQRHQPQGEHHRRFAPDPVGIGAEYQATDGAHAETDTKGRQGQQQLPERALDREKLATDQRGEEAVDGKIVELETGADGDGGDGFRTNRLPGRSGIRHGGRDGSGHLTNSRRRGR
ncbi:hypothetical protein D9M72_562400 [compost metagenome]